MQLSGLNCLAAIGLLMAHEAHAADAPANPEAAAAADAEAKAASQKSSDTASYILMAVLFAVIVVAGILIHLRLKHNKKRFTERNAYFDRFRARPKSPTAVESEYELHPSTPSPQTSQTADSEERPRTAHDEC